MTGPKLDWLDDEPAPTRAIERSRAAKKAEERKLARSEKTVELTLLFAKLPLEQRFWLRALVENAFNGKKARKALSARGISPPHAATATKWSTQPAYCKARDLLAELAYESTMPSKAALLLRLNEIAEYNVEEVDEYHQGEPTGRKQMRDVGAALKATELQGKTMKLFGEEKTNVAEGPQLVVQIISKEDPTRTIDVTPGRVRVSQVQPDDGEVIDAEPTDGGS